MHRFKLQVYYTETSQDRKYLIMKNKRILFDIIELTSVQKQKICYQSMLKVVGCLFIKQSRRLLNSSSLHKCEVIFAIVSDHASCRWRPD